MADWWKNDLTAEGANVNSAQDVSQGATQPPAGGDQQLRKMAAPAVRSVPQQIDSAPGDAVFIANQGAAGRGLRKVGENAFLNPNYQGSAAGTWETESGGRGVRGPGYTSPNEHRAEVSSGIPQTGGGMSTEKTITFEYAGKSYVVPSIINGVSYTPGAAIELWKSGKNPALGIFNNEIDANRFAEQRSADLDAAYGGRGETIMGPSSPVGRSLQDQPQIQSSDDWYKKDLVADGSHLRGIPDAAVKSGPNVGVTGEFVAGFRSNDAEGIRYYAHKLFPNEPIDEAVKRFSVSDKNRIVYRADDGNYYAAEPSGGVQGFIGGAAEKVGGLIPMTAATVAGVGTAPLAATGAGLGASMAATAAAGGAGEYARQKIGDVLMGDASTNDTDVGQVAKEAAMSGLGQGIGVGVGKIIERNQVRDIDRLSKEYMDRTYAEAGKRGISVTPGQATGLKTLQAEEKRLATRVPETVDQMDEFLGKQSDDVQKAWYKALDKIAPSKDAAEVGSRVRQAAQGALDDVTAARSKAATPLYDAWRAQANPVNTTPIIDRLNEEIGTAARGGATSRALNAVKTYLTNPDGTPVTDPVKLHNARMEIGNIIDTRSIKGTSINNTIVGKMKGIMSSLTQEMDDASVGPDGKSLYMAARRSFSDLSSDVNDAFSSSLQRIANLNDTNILSTVKEAFDPRSRSPEMIKKLGVKLAAKDPQAWQDLKRLWLQDTVADKLKPAQSGDVIGVAGKIVKALDDPSMRRSFDAALSSSEKQNLNDLKFVLQRIARANLSMGSDTAANQAADRLALERATPIWAKAQRALGEFYKIPGRVADASAERNMRTQAQKMVDIVTSGDKESLKAIKQLRRLSPKQWRALAASGQFGVRGANLAVGRVIAPPPSSLNTPESQPDQQP